MSNDYTQADYDESLEHCADIAENKVEEYDYEPAEAVFETVNSARWTFVTHQAIKTLQYSHNNPEEYDMFVGEDPTWTDVVTAMAFCCLRLDLYDVLRERDDNDF